MKRKVDLLSKQFLYFFLAFSKFYASTKKEREKRTRRANHHHANKIYRIYILLQLELFFSPTMMYLSVCLSVFPRRSTVAIVVQIDAYTCGYFFFFSGLCMEKETRKNKRERESILFFSRPPTRSYTIQ